MAELAAVKANVLVTNERIQPPVHMTDAEMSVWHQVVNDNPADAFTDTHIPMLEMYCRHVVTGRILADEILNFDRSWLADEEGLKRYDTLLKMAQRESNAAHSIARGLRLTRQSIDQQTIARMNVKHQKNKKPWELPETIDEEG